VVEGVVKVPVGRRGGPEEPAREVREGGGRKPELQPVRFRWLLKQINK
jgi:hypothetical protein